VRDVEEANTVTAVQMLLNNAFGVQDWHVITRERNHLGLEHILMVGVKVCALEGLSGELSDNLA
jgi:hypothetical protein